MPAGRTKTRKLRGHVSHGHGRVGKHRKHSGGRGKCGGLKHRRSWFTKYQPDHFGKYGQRAMHYQKSRHWWPEINLERVWRFVPKNDVPKYLEGDVAAPVIDLVDFGYAKVVGDKLPIDRPVVLRAKSFSKEAEEAVVKAGGMCLLRA